MDAYIQITEWMFVFLGITTIKICKTDRIFSENFRCSLENFGFNLRVTCRCLLYLSSKVVAVGALEESDLNALPALWC